MYFHLFSFEMLLSFHFSSGATTRVTRSWSSPPRTIPGQPGQMATLATTIQKKSSILIFDDLFGTAFNSFSNC